MELDLALMTGRSHLSKLHYIVMMSALSCLVWPGLESGSFEIAVQAPLSCLISRWERTSPSTCMSHAAVVSFLASGTNSLLQRLVLVDARLGVVQTATMPDVLNIPPTFLGSMSPSTLNYYYRPQIWPLSTSDVGRRQGAVDRKGFRFRDPHGPHKHKSTLSLCGIKYAF